MNRKIWIASVVGMVGLLCALAPAGACAGSPLLSGYGGPGAGEQAIVGSTLLNGPRGGAGGSSGSNSGGGGLAGSSSTSGAASGSAGASSVKRTGGTSASGVGSKPSRRRSKTEGANGSPARTAYVYPSTPASAQGDSSATGLSSGDLLALIAIAATIGLIGVVTVRLSRLQP